MFLIILFNTIITASVTVFACTYNVNNLLTTNDLIIKTTWYGMKTYTILQAIYRYTVALSTQLIFRPIYEVINPPSEVKCISFIKNGNVTQRYSWLEYEHSVKKGIAVIFPEYDFILYEWEADDTDTKYDTYMLLFTDHLKVSDNFQISETNLLIPQIHINSAAEPIFFNFERNCYYIDGNILFTRGFVTWYLKSHYNRILNTADDFTVSFINEDIECIKLENNANLQQSLVLTQHNYSIRSVSKTLNLPGNTELTDALSFTTEITTTL